MFIIIGGRLIICPLFYSYIPLSQQAIVLDIVYLDKLSIQVAKMNLIYWPVSLSIRRRRGGGLSYGWGVSLLQPAGSIILYYILEYMKNLVQHPSNNISIVRVRQVMLESKIVKLMLKEKMDINKNNNNELVQRQ